MAALVNTRDTILRVASPRYTNYGVDSQIKLINTTLANIASDTLITESERQALRKEWDQIIAEYVNNSNQGLAYLDNLYPSVATYYSNGTTGYADRMQELATYLNAGTTYTMPSLGSSPTDAPNWISNANLSSTATVSITADTFRTKWKQVYDSRTVLINKATDEAGKVAGWSGITGTGKPSDNATSDIILVNTNGCTITGNTVLKTGGSDASWDAGVRTNYGYNGGAYVEATVTHTANSMLAFNTSASSGSGYTELYYALYTRATGYLSIYHLSNSVVDSITTYSIGDRIAVSIEAHTVNFLKNGVIIYSMSRVPEHTITWYLDTSFYTLGTGFANIKFNPIISSIKKGTNLFDTSGWETSASGNYNQPGGWTANPLTGTGTLYNFIRWNTGPDGSTVKTWIGYNSGSANNQAGGIHPSQTVTIDNTKKYRISVWIMKSGNNYEGSEAGSIYLGPQPNAVNDMSNGGLNNNPYVVQMPRSSLTYGVWYLLVGYIFPYTVTGPAVLEGGVFHGPTGTPITTGITKADYRWLSTTTEANFRIYQYYTSSNANAGIDIWGPRIEICDGSEPSLHQLLSIGSVSGLNKVTSNTTYNYMGTGAISTSGAADYSISAYTGTAAEYDSGVVTVATITTTSAPVKFHGITRVSGTFNGTTANLLNINVLVYIDNSLKTSSNEWVKVFPITGGVAYYCVIPFLYRLPGAAGSHNFQIKIIAEFRDSSNSVLTNYWNFTSNTFYLVEEIKV